VWARMATIDKPGPAPVALAAAASPPPPTQEQLEVLREVGEHWASALGGRRRRKSTLPVDPDLPHHTGPPQRISRYERVAEPEFVAKRRGELTAMPAAGRPRGPTARWLYRARRAALGPPLATTSLVEERLRKPVALAVLSSDALSSVAYGTEAMLAVLILAGSGVLWHSLPIGGVIVLLMVTVALSYRQTIKAYPRGGGSYIVASDNLGPLPGLTAAAGLMMDYILTVAVSVTAGVAAVTSAFPELTGARIEIGVGAIAVILLLNLRGLRQAGAIFAVPTYVFVVSILGLVAYGLIDAAVHGFPLTDPPPVAPVEALTLFVILRAFASGATAMTGIEAISDGVPTFKPPEWRNARTTLTWMITLLATMFAGITLLTYMHGLVPEADNTILSQLTESEWGRGVLYGVVQASTALILVLAANTAFNDFPRLLFFLGRDRYAPRLFTRLGDRLAYSNGIVVLAGAAAVLVVAFDGRTDRLIALYAIGVFLAFTLSQTGMVVRWWRRREPNWKRGLSINLLGAAMSAGVLLVVAVTKFTEGAWVVIVLIPVIVMAFWRIHSHYAAAGRAIALVPVGPERGPAAGVPRLFRPHPDDAVPSEQAESPDELEHLSVVPVASMDRASLRALAYAVSMGHPTLALHVSPDEDGAERMREMWVAWGDHVPLQMVVSPYRSLVAAILNYLAAVHSQRPALTLTVVLPELVTARWWQRILHNQVARRLRAVLRPVPGVVLISVPFHLPRR
jgi:amino acid transporter